MTAGGGGGGGPGLAAEFWINGVVLSVAIAVGLTGKN